MLSIQTNAASMNAQENLRVTSLFQGRTIARLTLGFRINESGDDAAGLAIANKYRSDITELQQGVRNANDGLSTLQIVDGGLSNISKMLDRLKTLATQSASTTFSGNRVTLNNEFESLLNEIDRQASNIGLGDGTAGAAGGASNVRSIGVYVGGGKSMENSRISIDLAGDANRASSAGLAIKGTRIEGQQYIAKASGAYTKTATSLAISYNGSGLVSITSTTNDDAAAMAYKINTDATAAGKVFAVLSADGSRFDLYANDDVTITAGGQTVTGGATAETVEATAQAASAAVSAAVERLGRVQGKAGTGQNQLGYAIQLAQSQITSYSAAESRIRDADVASEAANLTKAQVLQQASLAALAQANSSPQSVLSLLRG